MPLTDQDTVETIQEGEGGEDFSTEKSIDYFSSLLQAAKLHLSESVSFAARLQARLTKMEARLQDWLEFNEDIIPQRKLPLLRQTSSQTLTSAEEEKEELPHALASRSSSAQSLPTASEVKKEKRGVSRVSKKA